MGRCRVHRDSRRWGQFASRRVAGSIPAGCIGRSARCHEGSGFVCGPARDGPGGNCGTTLRPDPPRGSEAATSYSVPAGEGCASAGSRSSVALNGGGSALGVSVTSSGSLGELRRRRTPRTEVLDEVPVEVDRLLARLQDQRPLPPSRASCPSAARARAETHGAPARGRCRGGRRDRSAVRVGRDPQHPAPVGVGGLGGSAVEGVRASVCEAKATRSCQSVSRSPKWSLRPRRAPVQL